MHKVNQRETIRLNHPSEILDRGLHHPSIETAFLGVLDVQPPLKA